MKRHRIDTVSLAAGLVFVATAGFWGINRLADEPISPGWTIAGVLVLLAAIVGVSAIDKTSYTTNGTPQQVGATQTAESRAVEPNTPPSQS